MHSNVLIMQEKIEKDMKTMRRFIAKKLTPLIDAIDDLQKKDEKNSKRIDALTKNSQVNSHTSVHTFATPDLQL